MVRRIEPIATWLQKWFRNPNNTPMAQVILSFSYGILLSPWSAGLFFLVITIIIYEILYYIYTNGYGPYYNSFIRVGVICSSIIGYIVGRTLCNNNEEVLKEGVPEFSWSYLKNLITFNIKDK